MKPVIAKEDVANAIKALTDNKKKPTIAAIHAALGNRGSLTTVVQLKRQIDAESAAGCDSEQSLKAFRDVWQLALAEGRKQCLTEAAELQQAVNELAAENERLDGQLTEASQRLAQLERERDDLVADLRGANEQVTGARAAGEQAASRLASALDRLVAEQDLHRKEVKELTARLTQSEQNAHRFEIQLARAEGRLSSHVLAPEKQ